MRACSTPMTMKETTMVADRKRLDKIESSLTPREIVALWVQEIAKSDSMEEYASWAVDNLSRSPLLRMLQQLKDGMPKRSGGQNESEFRELFRSEVKRGRISLSPGA